MSTEPAAAELALQLQNYLAEHPQAVLLEDGRVLFDMRVAKYAIKIEHGRCVMHVWSEEGNIIRRVIAVSARKDSLFLETQRMGLAKPQRLELAVSANRKVASTQAAARSRYLRVLQRVLERNFPEFKVSDMRSAMDLTRSFGPAYARGTQTHGQTAWAVCGVNASESQSTVDGILTVGILWLEHCRERGSGKRLFHGLRLIVPTATAEVTISRMAWLNGSAAQWELYELDDQTEELTRRDAMDFGNMGTHLTHAGRDSEMLSRFEPRIGNVLAMLPQIDAAQVETRLRSGNEAALLLHGLEFARIRVAFEDRSFSRTAAVTFGTGENETPLTEDTEELFRALATELFARRSAAGDKRDPLYRMQPERWLESEVRRNMEGVSTDLLPDPVYSQVPAFSAGDRGMLDLLAVTRAGRLAVLELKAGEDLHLPLQGLDYWMRVRWHMREFQRFGYFPGVELSSEPPLLMLVAPALHVHPAAETVLKYLSPEVEWHVIAVDERWREKIAVVFRKRSPRVES